MAHTCPHRAHQVQLWAACPRRQASVHRPAIRCKATLQVPELPPDMLAELDELEKSKYCGGEGTLSPSKGCLTHFACLTYNTSHRPCAGA